MSEQGLDFLIALEVEVGKQSGVRLPDVCAPQPMLIRYEHVGGSGHKGTTQGCGEHSMFVVPYDGEKPAQQGFVRFCAFCDGCWHWPRFRGVA